MPEYEATVGGKEVKVYTSQPEPRSWVAYVGDPINSIGFGNGSGEREALNGLVSNLSNVGTALVIGDKINEFNTCQFT